MDKHKMETRYYEGCGQEGPIRCIFLSEFHPVVGPKIVSQFPDDYLSKEIFDAVSVYIIPKPQLQKCTVTINAFGHKIIGYPIRIDDERYVRNAYLFNLCFVCDSWSKTVQYEPVVKKLGEHLAIMEQETTFVSSGSSKLPTLLAHLLHDLNTFRKATLVEGETVMYLKVLEVRKDPIPVHDHDVPIFNCMLGQPKPPGISHISTPTPSIAQGSASIENTDYESKENVPTVVDVNDDWDLTTRKILPYIDGFKHILQIAAETDVEKNLIKSCVQNLVYYGVVSLLPILLFSNVYRATPELNRLLKDQELQQACINFITPTSAELPSQKATMSEVFAILCGLQQGVTLRMVCEKFPVTKSGVLDVRRLIVFALMHGLLKCLKKYPVYVKNPGAPESGGARSLFTGRNSLDEICCLTRIPMSLLEKLVEDDPDVHIIWR